MNPTDIWKHIGPPDENGCRLWLQGCDGDGYGHFRDSATGKTAKVSRVVWEQTSGQSIPTGLMVRHSCDNPPCVESTHLILGTGLDNIHDRDSRGRHAGASQTSCHQGHEFTPENTYEHNGKRHCRACRRKRERAYRTGAKP